MMLMMTIMAATSWFVFMVGFTFASLSCFTGLNVLPGFRIYPAAVAAAAAATVGNFSAISTLRIGFLSSFRFGLGKIIAGAIPLAIEHINQDSTILPNHKLEFIVGECGQPSSFISIQEMTKMKTLVQAFVGPDESCASEALVASAWNKPLISYKCIDQNLSDKSKYPTFARTLPPSSKISKSVISLLTHFEWNKVVLIVSENPAYKQMLESLSKLASKHGIAITDTQFLPGHYISRFADKIEAIVEGTHRKTRVYILLTETFVVADFLQCMARKHLLGSGRYAIISVEEEVTYSVKQTAYQSSQYSNLPLQDDRLDLRGLLIVTASPPSNRNYVEFQNKVVQLNRMAPFCIPYHRKISIQVPVYAGLAYDAVMVLAKAFHKVIVAKQDLNDGIQVIEAIKNLTYKSILGFSVHIDQNGEAEGNYTLLAMKAVSGRIKMQIVGAFQQTDHEIPVLNLTQNLKFYGNGPPLGEPKCGFNNEFCDYGLSKQSIVIVSGCMLLATMGVFFVFKHYHYEYKLTKSLWKIDLKEFEINDDSSEGIRYPIDIQLTQKMSIFRSNQSSVNRVETSTEMNALVDIFGCKNSVSGNYKGNLVFAKRIHKRSIDLTRNVRKELIQMREVRHDNLNSFIGACIDAPNISLFFAHCTRKSLEEVIKNKDLNLLNDKMFVASLVADLIKGMIYLHDSDIISHGNLKPSNCLIDSRWVLQITDYGLHEFKSNQERKQDEEDERKKLLWRAPELLRDAHAPVRGSQKGDIYSFALILFEIIARKNPFEEASLSSKDILQRILHPQLYGMFRPNLNSLLCSTYMSKCIEDSWKEDPEERPDFRVINHRLREMQAGLKPNIFDNMIAMLEKYSYNLESVVQARTDQLLEEKKKTENLLLRMLPKSVAEQLKTSATVEAEFFDCVTIYFSDIVGFTELSAVSTPIQVVKLLNDLYTCFDSIIGNYDVYKVETIGDAYMVVSGLPLRNSDKHAGEIASMALHLQKEIFNFEIAHRPGEYLKLRIGIHTGPCVAGVVGLKMPRYCLFGDTVNVASRMESTGEAHKIHVSYSCKQILDKLGGYRIEDRGIVSIKGKGEMRTYWLLDNDNNGKQ